ncbi:hypothetical protein [Sphingomonas sp. PB4P5]|uniref:hypothetical protein n=1 Tax=Parasphingomonas puruogangriensis TaxID=3096155 RepID=UPI002FC59443
MTNTTELIDRLCTFAGMLLEDVHEVALVRSASSSAGTRIEMIRSAASDAVVLARAAEVIRARYGSIDGLEA